jgi:hypothetical protein
MKFPHIITRRRAKWTGLATTLILAAAMIASYRHQPRHTWASPFSSHGWCAQVHPGVLDVVQVTDRDSWGVYDAILAFRKGEPLRLLRAGTSIHHTSWLPNYFTWNSSTFSIHIVSVPLWIPLVLCALPTMLLFYRDRKPKPGCCATCRYDLAGLKGDKCPECGTKIATTDSIQAPTSAAEGENGVGLGVDGVGLGENGVG